MVEPSLELQRVIRFFETISKQSVLELAQLYADDAYFKDPFNEVRGLAPIQQIFLAMFEQVDAPSFKIVQAIQGAGTMLQRSDLQAQGIGELPSMLPMSAEAFLIWEFNFRFKRFKRNQVQVVKGSTHLRFDQVGKIVFHRDYWDAAEELYEKIPLLGALMRFLRRCAQH